MRAWFYGPNGQAEIFTDPADIPAGWADAPHKVPAHPLDRDGDGEPGGSLKRRRRRKNV